MVCLRKTVPSASPLKASLRGFPEKAVLRFCLWKPVLSVSPLKAVIELLRVGSGKAAFGICQDQTVGHLKENTANRNKSYHRDKLTRRILNIH